MSIRQKNCSKTGVTDSRKLNLKAAVSKKRSNLICTVKSPQTQELLFLGISESESNRESH